MHYLKHTGLTEKSCKKKLNKYNWIGVYSIRLESRRIN